MPPEIPVPDRSASCRILQPINPHFEARLQRKACRGEDKAAFSASVCGRNKDGKNALTERQPRHLRLIYKGATATILGEWKKPIVSKLSISCHFVTGNEMDGDFADC